MNEPFDPLRILAALQVHGVRAVVVGGLATIAHGADATTDDVDVCVDGADDNLDRLAFTLAQLGARSVGAGMSGDVAKETFATNAGTLDCLELPADAFDELWSVSPEIEVGRGVRAHVVPLDRLPELKRHTGNLAETVRVAALAEEARVEEAPVAASLDEYDELSRPDDPPTRARDKVWHALESVDTFLTKLVDR